MATKKIPVSFDFFKKYSHHEECVVLLLKLHAKGDQQLYDRLLSNKEYHDKALKAYYEAFYLKPKIRDKFHIRFKSAPKRIKDKLLAVPGKDAYTKNNVKEQNEGQDVTEIVVKDLGSNKTASQNKNTSLKHMLATQNICDGDCIVDDDEPFSSPDVSVTLDNPLEMEPPSSEKQNQKRPTCNSDSNCNQENQETVKVEKTGGEGHIISHHISGNDGEICNKSMHGANVAAKGNGGKYKNKIINKNSVDNDNGRAKDLENIQQMNTTSADGVATNSANEFPRFAYNELIPYLHCCPLSFKEFRKYSNIEQLVAEFCKARNIDARKQRVILHRSHLLFYLAPENREIPPINGIQLSDNCPLSIKEKFFSFPAKLYLKQEAKSNETSEAAAMAVDPVGPIAVNNNAKTDNELTEPVVVNVKTSPRRVTATKTAAFDTSKESKTKSVYETPVTTEHVQEIKPSKIRTIANKGKVQTKNVTTPTIQQEICLASKTVRISTAEDTYRASEKVHTPNITDTGNQSPQQLNAPAISSTRRSITTSKSAEADNNDLKKKETCTAPSSACDTIIKFPVSLNEFKKCTYYEEVVEKLFKLKSQDNEELFLKYKSSQQAFDDTLMKYYRAFYLLPAIRQIWPIRLKPMPGFKRNLLLRIPEGVIMTPLNNFTANQLILSDLYNIDFDSKVSLSTAEVGPEPASKAAEGQSREETKLAVKSESGPDTTDVDIVMTAIKVENNTESTDSNKCLKRTSNEAVESTSSPKRPKIEQNPNKAKRSYQDLLPYAHCCPVTFTDFTKYSNVSELFAGFCRKRYNSMEKLPYMLKRAYVLFYLAPENRRLKPFNKFKVTDECPSNLKETMFEIPSDVLKEHKKDLSTSNKITTEGNDLRQMAKVSTANIQQSRSQQQTINLEKPQIEILENRLLPPISQPYEEQNNECSICLNNCCLFSHITNSDIEKHTNIASVHSEPLDLKVIQNIFKQLIYKVLNKLSCDENYMISSALTCKILQHKVICDKCKADAQTIPCVLTSARACSVAESDRTSNTSFETVIRGCTVNNKGTSSSTLTNASIVDRSSRNMSIDKSSLTKQAENVTNSNQAGQTGAGTITVDMRNDKRLFSEFCQKLLNKLQQSIDGTVDFSSDCYKIFLECNAIPLRELLKDVFGGNGNNVQSILNEKELYEALQRYYYFKYMTDKEFALKYPVEVIHKIAEKRLEEAKDKSNATVLDGANISRNSLNDGDNSLFNSINIHDESVTDNVSLNKSINNANSISNNTDLEKAKRIFFRNFDKTHTLAYVLRTTFGYKHDILRTILNFTFDEFLELTSIYEGKELYADKHVAECMYRFVFRTPLVWPTNLFITLQNLCNFLYKNNIHFDNYSTMLFYISPKVLHWSNLLSCTNILDCVKCDYEKRTGKLLDTDNISCLKQECIEYYNRCWKHEKWLADTPLVNEEFCRKIAKDIADQDAMVDEPTTLCCCTDVAGNHAPNCISDLIVFSPTETNRSTPAVENCNDFNCVLLPNTQQQIEMLPAEQGVTNDPLNNSDDIQFQLNVSQSSPASSEVETVDEITQPVKLEPVEGKLLSNLVFYEDENNEMQCVPCEDEIVELDTTLQSQQIAKENLPSSQIDFDVLVNGGELQSFLLQHFRNTAEDSNGAGTQQISFPSDQLMELPDTVLLNSGETAHSYEKEPVLNKLLQTSADGSNSSSKNDTTVLQEAQRFPSTFEDTQTSSGAAIEIQHHESEKISAETIKHIIDSILDVKSQQQENSTSDKPIDSSNPKTSNQSSYQTIADKAKLPKRVAISDIHVTATKSNKNVATVKPLPASGLVPQIQHNTRPLQTAPLFNANIVNNNIPKQSAESQIFSPPSLMLNLTPASSGQSSAGGLSSQNSSFQLQIPHLNTRIFISEELNNNCSVFDSSSLLRIVDHNYNNENPTNLMESANEQMPAQVEPTHEEVIISDDMCPDNNSLANDESSQNNEESMVKENVRPARKVTKRNFKYLPKNNSRRISHRISSLQKNTSNKSRQDFSKIDDETIKAIASISDATANEEEHNVDRSSVAITTDDRKERRGFSYVWNFVEKLSRHTIRCKLCTKIMNFHGTANVITHLQRRHNVVRPSPRSKLNQRINAKTEPLSAASVARKLCTRISQDQVRCCFCKRNFSSQNISNVVRHLQCMHGTIMHRHLSNMTEEFIAIKEDHSMEINPNGNGDNNFVIRTRRHSNFENGIDASYADSVDQHVHPQFGETIIEEDFSIYDDIIEECPLNYDEEPLEPNLDDCQNSYLDENLLYVDSI